MGKITCGCLNVRIHSKTDDLNPCELSQLGVQIPSHEFFSSPVAEVFLNLEGITTVHKSLLKSSTLGDWILYKCINCKLWTHASTGGNRILVNMQLRSDPSLFERLEQSPDFSPLYRIVLQARNENQHIAPLSVQSGKYESLQETLTTIQQHLNKFLMEEEAAMEERIKKYENAQRDAYASLQSKARRDKNTMISLILNSEETDISAAINEAIQDEVPSNIRAVPQQKAAAVTRQPFTVKSSPSPASTTVKRVEAAVVSKPRSALSSMMAGGRDNKRPMPQTEDVFDFDPTFDDANNQQSFYMSDDDETEDTDDSEPERGSMPSGRVSSLYSSSVPVSIPMWGSAAAANTNNSRNNHFSSRKSFEEEEEDDLLPQDPEDMAASIKALARSVHADSTQMFGELPRSRFKTDYSGHH